MQSRHKEPRDYMEIEDRLTTQLKKIAGVKAEAGI
jgi:hypothetical protein